ncbi:MAG: M81 family metallopeptidase, partial [Acidobacteria bacterium]|nr:M81 family metallopeptidase [Acidobacteriota bacterium]
MRIGLPVVVHETNTFADSSTGQTEYKHFDVLRGDEVVDFWQNSQTPPGGMIDAIGEIGVEAIPIYSAFAQPSGTITKAAYDRIVDELLSELEANLPYDALAVTLHGAGVAEGIDEIEADLSRRIREVVGPDVPLVGVFDLHGNVTPDVAEPLDAFFGYHLYPHEDMYERGREAVQFIVDLVEKRVQPVTHVEYVPVLLPTSTTDFGPAAEANRLCAEIEARPGIIDCTFFHGFPYADVPLVGAHAVAIADGDPELARSAARELARWIWDHREDFRTNYLPADEAVAKALARDDGPVVINEGSDNCGGGAPGDGTH